MKKYIDIPPVWALATAIMLWALANFIPVYQFDAPMVISVGLVGLGVALAGWSAIWFLRKKTTIEPRHVPTTLIIEGPFRINRNPIYTGMFLVLLGFAFWLGDIIALIFVIDFPLIITYRFIKDEEAQLHQSFSAEADAYIAKTRRW